MSRRSPFPEGREGQSCRRFSWWFLGFRLCLDIPTLPSTAAVTTAVDKSPAYARLLAVAPAGDLTTAPTPRPGTRPVSSPLAIHQIREVYLHAYDTVAQARASLGRYLDFYNRKRPHSSPDARTPDQAYFDQPPLLAAA